MTLSSVTRNANRELRTWAVVLSALLITGGALANITNSLPYEEGFEGLTDGTPLAGTNGWYSEEINTSTVVTAESYTYPLGLPLDTTHDNIVVLAGSVSNLLSHAGGDTNVWVDMMLKPSQNTGVPQVDENIQLALYFDGDGIININHRYWADDFASKPRTWSKLDHAPIPSNKWVRLTIKMDYLTSQGATADEYFQITLNGGEPLSGFYGLPSTDWYLFGDYPANPPPRNGTWFLNVNTEFDFRNINSIELTGTGAFDDTQVKTTNVLATAATTYTVTASVSGSGGTIYPAGTLNIPEGDDVTFEIITLDPVNYVLDDVLVDTVSVGTQTTYTISNVTAPRAIEAVFVESSSGPVYTAKGVPESWYEGYAIGVDDMGHDDDDGVPNWEEYVAGTDPTDGNSYFRVLGVQYSGTSNKVSWYATTGGGAVTDPFSMLRTTDLVADDWAIVDGTSNAIVRVDGTNVWWDTAPPADPVSYRPVVLWTVE